jgi:hypothetical protein
MSKKSTAQRLETSPGQKPVQAADCRTTGSWSATSPHARKRASTSAHRLSKSVGIGEVTDDEVRVVAEHGSALVGAAHEGARADAGAGDQYGLGHGGGRSRR